MWITKSCLETIKEKPSAKYEGRNLCIIIFSIRVSIAIKRGTNPDAVTKMQGKKFQKLKKMIAQQKKEQTI